MVARVRTAVAVIGVMGVVAQVWVALAQAPPSGSASSSSRAVATVGTQRIEADEFERRVSAAQQQYASRGVVLPAEARSTLRRQVLEGAIRGELVALEARRTGALVPIAEAEAALRNEPVFNPGGRFDEPRWLTIKANQKAQFEAAVDRMRGQLSGQRMTEQLVKRFTPSEAQLRSEAERQMGRADLAYLLLPTGEFEGTFPEPREQAVVDRYRRDRASYQRPDQLTLSIVIVNTPGLSPDERKDGTRVREWTARMRHSADSLLHAARAGADLEVLAIPHGGVRPKISAIRTRLPAFWNGTAADVEALFAAKRGTYLPSPVAATEGFLVVRLDDRSDAHLADISEVAKEIRGQLRDDLKRNHVEYAMRDLHSAMRDTMAGEAWRVRWVFADPQTIRVPEPSASDIERYYRSRLADYSRFDSEAGRIVATPLAEVREDALQRLRTERRVEAARAQAERIHRAWVAGKREPSLERESSLQESEATPRGAGLDLTSVGTDLAPLLWRAEDDRSVGIAPVGGGFAVWHKFEHVRRHVPTYQQARPAVQRAFEADWALREERGARALFDADPSLFKAGDILSVGRANILPTALMDVPLTRAEVESWFRTKVAQFSAPEQMRARHILVSPTTSSDASDRAARIKAEALLARVRGGEDFAKVAREASDDEPTRDHGGELGTFGRGVMLPGFETVAFTLRPGQMSGLVRTQAGYHIILCVEYEPEIIQPLDLVYANVASDLARVKADSLAVLRADSLIRVHRDPKALKAAVERSGFEVLQFQHRIGDYINSSQVRPFFDALEKLKAGEILRPAFRARGSGAWVAWVDSLSPPRIPTWEEARPRALIEFRAGAGKRALEAKRAEIDSLRAAGWSADSVAALWGGSTQVPDLTPGREIKALGATQEVDAFVFGNKSRPAAKIGQSSAWIEVHGGLVQVTVMQRHVPDIQSVQVRMQQLRGEHIESAMRRHFAELAMRHAVRIHDAALRDTPLPEARAIDVSGARR